MSAIMRFHCIRLALEFTAIGSLIRRELEFDIPVYSNYAVPKHHGFWVK